MHFLHLAPHLQVSLGTAAATYWAPIKAICAGAVATTTHTIAASTVLTACASLSAGIIIGAVAITCIRAGASLGASVTVEMENVNIDGHVEARRERPRN